MSTQPPKSKVQTKRTPKASARAGTPATEKMICAFCDEPIGNQLAIANKQNVLICSVCVAKAAEFLKEDTAKGDMTKYFLHMAGHLHPPRALHAALNGYIVGQEAAKRTLAVAIYIHYKRILEKYKVDPALFKAVSTLQTPPAAGNSPHSPAAHAVSAPDIEEWLKTIAAPKQKEQAPSFNPAQATTSSPATVNSAAIFNIKQLNKLHDSLQANTATLTPKQKKLAAELRETEIDKANILLIGPTGTGKTLLATTLARLLGVPFAIADATTLTESGYVGDDVENILLRLLQNANFDLAWAEKGIIFIDEIDKIARKNESASITRDVSGEGVQQALLKIIEGTVARVPIQGGRKHPQGQAVLMNTRDILFITGGAFVGLEQIIARRTNQHVIGFASKKPAADPTPQNATSYRKVVPDDLIKFGLIPELVGRLPIISTLSDLTDKELLQILTEPKHALMKQYRKLLQLENVTLEVKADFYDHVLKEAKKLKTGARALKSILESVMEPIFYEAPEQKGGHVKLSKATLATGNYFTRHTA